MNIEKQKIFVFDLDGTIIENNEPLDSSMNGFLKEMVDNGHTIIFSTSRSVRGVSFVLPKWCLNQIIIYCNGAFAKNDKRFIFENPIDADLVQEILIDIEAMNIPYYLEFGDYYFHPINIRHTFYDILKMEGSKEQITNKDIIYNKPVYKIVILEKRDFEKYTEKVEKYSKLLKMNSYLDGSIDITAKDCSKWSALSHILANKINASDVVSFGNDVNDYELLKNSTYSIAINPQNEDIKSVANKIIPSFDLKSIMRTITDILNCDQEIIRGGY